MFFTVMNSTGVVLITVGFIYACLVLWEQRPRKRPNARSITPTDTGDAEGKPYLIRVLHIADGKPRILYVATTGVEGQNLLCDSEFQVVKGEQFLVANEQLIRARCDRMKVDIAIEQARAAITEGVNNFFYIGSYSEADATEEVIVKEIDGPEAWDGGDTDIDVGAIDPCS